MGEPSPRPEGSAAASMLKTLPPEASTLSVSVVLHSSSSMRSSPSLKVTVLMSTPWPLRARTQPFFDRITVIGSSSTVRSTCARSSALMRVRRSSP